MNKNLILVFVRNPELGKVKTRLAKTIGDKDALKIYTILLQHTESVLQTYLVIKSYITLKKFK